MPNPTKPEHHNLKIKISSSYDDNHFDKFIEVHPCKRDSFPAALINEIPFWEPKNPVFIEAPTGMGKTTFVIKHLIPIAKANGKNVLLLGNRIALNVQVKRRILEEWHSPLLERLTDEGMRSQEDFECVKVLSYQSLGALLRKSNSDKSIAEWLANVCFVVADEAHYFVADALFNYWTGFSLRELAAKFRHAIRIYMTATAYDVRNKIAQVEESVGPTLTERFRTDLRVNPRAAMISTKQKMIYYHFPADYSFVDLQFVTGISSLKDIICSIDGKALVFVDSIEKGKEFYKDLSEALASQKKGNDSDDEFHKAIYLDASSKDSADWQMLVKTEKFEAKCLVATKALDNGINIDDDKLKNVIICSDDHVDLIQMLGRKRRNKRERVNLYVVSPTNSLLSNRKKETDDLLNTANTFMNTRDKGKILQEIYMNGKSEEYRCLFPMNPNGEIYLNDAVYIKLVKKQKLYNAILSGTTTFEDTVASWLGKTYTAPGTRREELTIFIESNLGASLNNEQQNTLRTKVYQAMLEAGIPEPHPKRVETLGTDALQNRMNQLSLPYIIDTFWRITMKSDTLET